MNKKDKKVATDYVKANSSIKLNNGIKSTKNIAEQFSEGVQYKKKFII